MTSIWLDPDVLFAVLLLALWVAGLLRFAGVGVLYVIADAIERRRRQS